MPVLSKSSRDFGVVGRAVAVTPSDSTVIGQTSGLYIGTTGSLTVQDDTGIVTYANHPAGYAPLRVTKVLASGTTAGGILALYAA